jgi:serine protease Do
MSDNYNDIFSSTNKSENDEAANTTEQTSSNTENVSEGSYEWNRNDSPSNTDTEYHYSYVNGNNQNAAHNPNNYDNAYSGYQSGNQQYSQQNNYSNVNTDANSSYGYNNSQQYNNQNGYQPNQYAQQYSSDPYAQQQKPEKKKRIKREKKPEKPVSRRFMAIALAITILASAGLGFGGGYLATHTNSSSSNGTVNITKVESSGTTATNTSASTATEVVKKAADSVVEITTESVVTGSFARQYVTTGAGSGVIISEDGYIITNNHVIDGANSITVTLRDQTTTYNATLIGTDSENDIALLKVDASGLSPATFGDSSNLAVGDYVVAIGNPLGELGGTVTDGIISALAREVTIEEQDMTLLQTNAEINPGNSGGGLFNANGELVGIVNAKDSATEVEGIGFAIPINNVLDIINDLKTYGYVTGKIDLGMELTDISSNETAFYYGVNQTGCYVLSVTKGSNADTAGFRAGDLITNVNGKEVSSSSDIKKILEDFNVDDTVKFTVSRSGKSTDLELQLAEYVPTGNSTFTQNNNNNSSSEDSDSIWQQMFGW